MAGKWSSENLGKMLVIPTLLCLFLFMALIPNTVLACMLSHDGGDEGGSMIQVTGHSIQGNTLVITYTIEYPGMTKVKLFNNNNELLWRSQYVDDKEGQHELRLKASVLNPGQYIFEFDYKNQKQNYRISV